MQIIDAFLVAAFLFFIGSCLGWCIEVVFRRCFTAKKWINPGFLTGPYLPLYGFGVVGLFAISVLPIDTGMPWLNAVIIILIMGAAMTLIEYIAGLIFIKGMKIKLWDYTDRWGNIQGIICPLFSLFWLLVAVFFYFVITAPVISAVVWFVHHIEFAFVVGMFMGIFLIDFAHAIDLSTKIRKFAAEHDMVVHFEKLKETLRERADAHHEKVSFVFPLRSFASVKEELLERREKFAAARKEKRKKRDET